jgi:zinc protease
MIGCKLRHGWRILLVSLGCSIFASACSPPAEARNVQTLTTPGGISLWLVEEHGLPIVALGFAIRGGSGDDPPGKEGLGHLLAAMLGEGAGPFAADEYKERLDGLGTRLSFSVSKFALSGQLVTIRRQLAPSAELLRLALRDAHLSESDLARVKQWEIADIVRRDLSPAGFAIRSFYEAAFAGHRYARPETGTPETLSRLSSMDLASQRERLLRKGGLHVVIVGALDAVEASATTDLIFGQLPPGEAHATAERAFPRTLSLDVRMPGGGGLETGVFAVPAPSLDDADYFPALALNQIIGSGNFDARLTQEIRVKRGLSYSIFTYLAADRVTSLALGTVSTEPGRMEEALTAIRGVFTDMQRDGPTAEELENAKTSLNGSYLLSLGSSIQLAEHLLGLWIANLSPDYDEIRKRKLADVTLDDTRRVAKTLFSPAAMSVLVARPAHR